MAFVSTPFAGLPVRHTFSRDSLCAQKKSISRSPTMLLSDREKASSPTFGTSQWRDNVFVGGFPGGELALRDWIETGANDAVPDVPDFLQPRHSKYMQEPKKDHGLTEVEKKSFAPMFGKSQWRENAFVGGFPGGEQALIDWVDGGGQDDVPDVPDFLQPCPSKEKGANSEPGLTNFEKSIVGGGFIVGEEAGDWVDWGSKDPVSDVPAYVRE